MLQWRADDGDEKEEDDLDFRQCFEFQAVLDNC